MQRLCQGVNAELGEEYEFVPQPITEGGITTTRWPGWEEGDRGQKDYRLGFQNWPMLEGSPPAIRAGGLDTHLMACRKRLVFVRGEPRVACSYRTRWKSYGGAPVWTAKEKKAVLDTIRSIFPRVKLCKLQ